MRKLFKKLHLWLSVPAGVVIFTTCLTGAMLVFKQEILEISYPERYFAEQTGKALPLDELIPIVNSQLEENSIASIQISSDPGRTYTATLKEGFRVSAFVNPYTGEVTGYDEFQKSGFTTIMRIHRWLMDGSRTWGKYAVGIATLLLIIILLTGLLIQPMSLLKRKTYKIRRGKALLYGLHNVLGIYACLILFIGAGTGLMWSFEWYRNGVFAIFGATEQVADFSGNTGKEGQVRGRQEQSTSPRNTLGFISENASEIKGKEGTSSGRPSTDAESSGKHLGRTTNRSLGSVSGAPPEETCTDYTIWQAVLEKLSAKNTNYRYIRIQDGRATVKLPSHPTTRATDSYSFDGRTGDILQFTPYRETDKKAKIWGWVYSLHVGDIAGLWTKIPVFLASIIGASLPVTGYWLYFRKRAKKRSKKVQLPFQNKP